jgi:malate/lactate dehydrogenase
MKIGVVGMGWVGSSVAASVLNSGLATELLLDDAIGRFADVATGLHANTGTEGPQAMCGDTAAR